MCSDSVWKWNWLKPYTTPSTVSELPGSVLLFDGVTVVRKSQRRLMQPQLQWSEVTIENGVADVNRRLSLRTRRARASLPAGRLSPESWSVVTGVGELRRAGIGARGKDRSVTRFPQRQQADGDGTRESAYERPTEYQPIA